MQLPVHKSTCMRLASTLNRRKYEIVVLVASIYVFSLPFLYIGDAHVMHGVEGFGATGALSGAGTTTSH